MILYLGLPRTFGGGDGARLHEETGATEIVLIACPTASPTLPDSTLLSAAQGHPVSSSTAPGRVPLSTVTTPSKSYIPDAIVSSFPFLRFSLLALVVHWVMVK